MKISFTILVLLLAIFSFGQERGALEVQRPEIHFERPARVDSVFEFTDVAASFPGGEVEMLMFIQANMEYPVESLNNDEFGKVYLKFIVRKDGRITDVSLIRGAHERLNNEAMRIVNIMPRWIPGIKDSVNVDSYLRLPFTFSMQ